MCVVGALLSNKFVSGSSRATSFGGGLSRHFKGIWMSTDCPGRLQGINAVPLAMPCPSVTTVRSAEKDRQRFDSKGHLAARQGAQGGGKSVSEENCRDEEERYESTNNINTTSLRVGSKRPGKGYRGMLTASFSEVLERIPAGWGACARASLRAPSCPACTCWMKLQLAKRTGASHLVDKTSCLLGFLVVRVLTWLTRLTLTCCDGMMLGHTRGCVCGNVTLHRTCSI